MNVLIVTACPNGQVTSVLCSRLLQAPPSAWVGKPVSRCTTRAPLVRH